LQVGFSAKHGQIEGRERIDSMIAVSASKLSTVDDGRILRLVPHRKASRDPHYSVLFVKPPRKALELQRLLRQQI